MRPMSEFSKKRLENRIIEIISTLILQGQIKNPNLSTLTSITDVELSSDNSHATVYVSSVLGDASLEKSVKALQSASAFIQSRIAQNLKTRNTPVLVFKTDRSFREGERINGLISEAMKDIKDDGCED